MTYTPPLSCRATEWLSASFLIGFALILSQTGDTFETNPYISFRRFGIDERLVQDVVFIIGVIRIMALIINGTWRRTPLLRMVGAVLGAAIYAGMAFLFLHPVVMGQQGLLTTNFATCTILLVADVVAAHRSGLDHAASKRKG